MQLNAKITIDQLWDSFVKYGYEVRHGKKKGYDAWSVVKTPLASIDNDCKFSIWNNKSVTYYDLLKNKLGLNGDTIVDANGNETNDVADHLIWEPHHFMLQHGRIVKNNKPSLLRLLQIAYNAGQLRAERQSNGDKAFANEQISFYNDSTNGMTYIRSYISELDQQKLEEINNNESLSSILTNVMKIISNVDTLPSVTSGNGKSIMLSLYEKIRIAF
jgi:hypothetical protein